MEAAPASLSLSSCRCGFPFPHAHWSRALIQTVAKAHIWWDQLKDGEMGSLTEIARREGIDKPKATRLLCLAFQSPRRVRQIRDGSHPVGVTVTTLTRADYLPLMWEEQDTIVASLK